MQHLAILKKEWNLIPKIISGEKSIETRWYKNKIAPWGKVSKGDIIFFKDAGGFVSAKAIIEKVEFIEITSEKKRQELIQSIWKLDLCTEDLIPELEKYAERKRYCIIVYLKNPEKIKEFQISKKGYGMQCAWIVSEKLNKV